MLRFSGYVCFRVVFGDWVWLVDNLVLDLFFFSGGIEFVNMFFFLACSVVGFSGFVGEV